MEEIKEQPATKYTFKKNKVVENWLFHPDYFTEQTRFLPMSQQNLVRNRLIQSKTLPIEEANIKDLHPVIKSKIDAIVLAYEKKQERARLYSEKKREKKPIDEQPQAVDSDDSEGEELNEIINGKPKTINFENIDEKLNDFHKKFGM